MLCPRTRAETGLRWHLRACEYEKDRFADFALTRIGMAKALDSPIPVEEQIESDVQWADVVNIEFGPHLGVAHPKAIEADSGIENGILALDMRAPLVGYALRRWSVDRSTDHIYEPREHHVWLSNPKTLYGTEGADLAADFKRTKGHA